MSATVTVVEVREVTAELVAAIERLLPQLSTTAPKPGAAELAEIVASPTTTLFVARDGAAGPIVGTVTLAAFRILSGKRGRIESLIVDAAARGRGVGRALCQAAIERARTLGVATIDLTCVPAREAANHLYVALGFKQRATNVYRYTVRGS